MGATRARRMLVVMTAAGLTAWPMPHLQDRLAVGLDELVRRAR